MHRDRIVGDAELAILLERDLADDDDRAAMVEPRIGVKRREIRRAPRHRLRIGKRSQRENETRR